MKYTDLDIERQAGMELERTLHDPRGKFDLSDGAFHVARPSLHSADESLHKNQRQRLGQLGEGGFGLFALFSGKGGINQMNSKKRGNAGPTRGCASPSGEMERGKAGPSAPK